MTYSIWPGRESEARRLGIELIQDGIFRGLPRNGFGVIGADPPWHFKSGVNSRHALAHYPTMKMADIRALPVLDLAAPDCALFLWTSAPFLDQSISVMKGWGFRYTSIAFTWLKLQKRHRDALFLDKDVFIALGHTSRKSTEICLLGKRGKPNRLSKSIHEVIIAARREHSRKPEAFYDRAAALYPGPCIDVFSRQARPGWFQFGNEAEKFGAPDPSIRSARGNHLDTDSAKSGALAPGGAL